MGIAKQHAQYENDKAEAQKALGYDGVVQKILFQLDQQRILKFFQRIQYKHLLKRFYKIRWLRRLLLRYIYNRELLRALRAQSEAADQVLYEANTTARYHYRDVLAEKPSAHIAVMLHADELWHKLYVRHMHDLLAQGLQVGDPKIYDLALQLTLRDLDVWHRLGQVSQAEYDRMVPCVTQQALGARQTCLRQQAGNELLQRLSGLSKRDQIAARIEHAKQQGYTREDLLHDIRHMADQSRIRRSSEERLSDTLNPGLRLTPGTERKVAVDLPESKPAMMPASGVSQNLAVKNLPLAERTPSLWMRMLMTWLSFRPQIHRHVAQPAAQLRDSSMHPHLRNAPLAVTQPTLTPVTAQTLAPMIASPAPTPSSVVVETQRQSVDVQNSQQTLLQQHGLFAQHFKQAQFSRGNRGRSHEHDVSRINKPSRSQ